MKNLQNIGIIVLIAVLGYGAYSVLNSPSDEVGVETADPISEETSTLPTPGYSIPSAGTGHQPSCTPEYNSIPPTSGCHSPSPAPYEIYTEPIPDERMVHSLEHGAIVINYQITGESVQDDQLVNDLTSLVNRLKNESRDNCWLILAPYPRNFQAPTVDELIDTARDKKISLAAWTHLDLLDNYEEERIIQFINAYIHKGPETLNDC
jgi:hypothetical protein